MDKRRKAFAYDLLGSKVDNSYRIETPGINKHSVNTPLESKPDSSMTKYSSTNDPQSTSSNVEKIRTSCFSCNTACEVIVSVDKANRKVVKVEGDPDSPVTKGVLCSKGLASKDLLYNPGRLRHPLKRTGKRGEGKWECISWDEALSITAEKLLSYRDAYGPEGVAFLEGTRRGWSRVFSRLANAFGAVNHGAAGWAQCLWPRLIDCTVTFGSQYMESADFENTNCMIAWGINPPATWGVRAADMMDARERGASLIVIDPYMSETAAKADLWLQLRPDTDTALALSMLNVIVNLDLVDHDFVDKWTYGFDKLKESIKDYNPEWGENITGVPSPLIIKAAKLYASSGPACIIRGVTLDQVHDSIQACRAVSLMAAVTGNIGIPGGNILPSSRGEISQNSHEFIMADMINPEMLPLRRGFDSFPLLCGKLSPVPTAHMPTLWETILTGVPYPVKAALIFGSNAVVSYSNTNKVREAIEKLDFLVVADLFMTPTAELADIVLPASSWLERDNVISSFQTSNTCTIVEQKVASLPEARSDVEIIIGLSEKLGLKHYFWKDPEDFYDYLLRPTGLKLDELKSKKRICAPLSYRQYEKSGFKTPSGKVELYSSLLEKNDCSPIPAYTESFESPLSTPELAREYPLTLTTGGRVQAFRHSENRQNPLLRELCPEPLVLIHPLTAQKCGITDGEPIIIETVTGTAKGIASLTEGLHPDIIQATPGWWDEGNINSVIPWGKYAEGIGTVCMRGILCRIKPASTDQYESCKEV